MAGSDLDGDEYAVLWNDDLIFYRENAAPGHFPSAPESEKPHITERDMIEFLVTYIKNDQHEAEVFSGAFNNLHYRFHERKDRDEIEKVVVRCIKRLTKSFNEEFHEEFKEKTNIKNIDVTVLQKASAGMS
ncbi:hypothetical protein JTE90_024821 [Oedothorax gibbosus]|uniref:RNA-dependent RNA polymerase n=1 Tax=Oedothorax gibbosus TaxID=931172 RepID=A0AAV6TCW5_9ARAC|nr:hypothetical protein JTE90_024821 [Oedothorax gibbosus]